MALAALLSLHDFNYRVAFGPEPESGVWVFPLANVERGRLMELVDLVRDFEAGCAQVEPVSYQQSIKGVRNALFDLLDQRRGQSSRMRRNGRKS